MTSCEIGEHATWHPEITKQVISAGITVGTHTWSHKDLARNPYAKDIEQAKAEIEMSISAVHLAFSVEMRAVAESCGQCQESKNQHPRDAAATEKPLTGSPTTWPNF